MKSTSAFTIDIRFSLEDRADSALRLNVATTTEHLRNDLGKTYGLVLY